MDIEAVATNIVDSAVKAHKALGPGRLESAYQACLAHELRKPGHHVVTELVLPVIYYGECIDADYRLDVLVDDCIIVETRQLII